MKKSKAASASALLIDCSVSVTFLPNLQAITEARISAAEY